MGYTAVAIQICLVVSHRKIDQVQANLNLYTDKTRTMGAINLHMDQILTFLLVLVVIHTS